ncbi:MAG: CBS domain-containing protein [Bryobacteraceae bacterium]|nr:CBS domain-containing protein [Bryobacteraceae bacterium]MDW8377224.1 hemolysin family protein [Bryobacterales bacterium]
MILFLLTVLLLLTALLVLAVSYVHLLCRQSLRIRARELPSLQFYRETLQEKLGLDAEDGALAYSLIRHFGIIALTVITMAIFVREEPLWPSILEASAVSALLMLITSYVVPRYLYTRTAGHWALALVGLLRLLAIAAKPVIALLDFVQSLADLSDKAPGVNQEPTQEEHIEALIEAGKEEGILKEKDEELIHSVVAFGAKTVREVMTPRPHIVAIAADKSLEDLRQLVINEQYSRVPVYEGTIDSIVGFVHVRDMFELEEQERAMRQVRSMMRPIPYVPETKPVDQLLREMQRDGVHMVVVIDEYGNTAGLATMEDLVEEILGEIRDEHEPGVDALPDGDGAYVVAGNFDLDNLKKLLDFTPDEGTEATTVGGLVTEWCGCVPKAGETVERAGIVLEVLASDDRRVERVRVRKALNGSH